jgi:hypothetical protein
MLRVALDIVQLLLVRVSAGLKRVFYANFKTENQNLNGWLFHNRGECRTMRPILNIVIALSYTPNNRGLTMEKTLILHMFTPEKNLSPFDVNMAVDAGWISTIPYTQLEPGEVTALVQDAIFSRGPGGVRRTDSRAGGHSTDPVPVEKPGPHPVEPGIPVEDFVVVKPCADDVVEIHPGG